MHGMKRLITLVILCMAVLPVFSATIKGDAIFGITSNTFNVSSSVNTTTGIDDYSDKIKSVGIVIGSDIIITDNIAFYLRSDFLPTSTTTSTLTINRAHVDFPSTDSTYNMEVRCGSSFSIPLEDRFDFCIAPFGCYMLFSDGNGNFSNFIDGLGFGADIYGKYKVNGICIFGGFNYSLSGNVNVSSTEYPISLKRPFSGKATDSNIYIGIGFCDR